MLDTCNGMVICEASWVSAPPFSLILVCATPWLSGWPRFQSITYASRLITLVLNLQRMNESCSFFRCQHLDELISWWSLQQAMVRFNCSSTWTGIQGVYKTFIISESVGWRLPNFSFKHWPCSEKIWRVRWSIWGKSPTCNLSTEWRFSVHTILGKLLTHCLLFASNPLVREIFQRLKKTVFWVSSALLATSCVVQPANDLLVVL